MTAAAPTEEVRPRRLVDPVLLGGGLLIVLQTIVRASIVFRSYYWHDDFRHLEMARRLGLSEEFLVRDYGGHLEIGQYVLYWLIGRDGGLSFAPAATSLVVMQLLASCLLLAVLRTLFGRSPWLLLPFAGYLFTPLSLTVATWWAAGMQALPLQITMLLTLLGLVLAIRRRSWRWAAVSVVGHGLGLAFWEKAVLIMPAVIAVLVLVEWAGEPLGRRARLLLGHWRILLPHVLLLAGYVAVYLSFVDGSSVLGHEPGDVPRTVTDTVFRMLVPGIFGGPWSEAGAVSTVYPYVGNALATFFAVVLLTVVALSVWLRGPAALQAWLLVAGYVAVDVALLQVGRADFVSLLSRDPRYITDALPIIAIGFCAAFSGPRVARRTPHWFRQAVASADSPLGAVAVLVSSCLLTSFLIDGVLQHDYSRNYVQALVTALEENPGASVVTTTVPQDVSVSTDHEGLLRAVGAERELDQPSTDMRMLDGLATLRPVTVIGPVLEVSGPVEDCGWQVGERWQWLGELRSAATTPQIVRVTYVTGQEAVLHLTVGAYEQAVPVSAGAGHASFVVTGHEGPVRVRVSDVAFGGLCVSHLVAGEPWPAD